MKNQVISIPVGYKNNIELTPVEVAMIPSCLIMFISVCIIIKLSFDIDRK